MGIRKFLQKLFKSGLAMLSMFAKVAVNPHKARIKEAAAQKRVNEEEKMSQKRESIATVCHQKWVFFATSCKKT